MRAGGRIARHRELRIAFTQTPLALGQRRGALDDPMLEFVACATQRIPRLPVLENNRAQA